jgi:hypothetical protein
VEEVSRRYYEKVAKAKVVARKNAEKAREVVREALG